VSRLTVKHAGPEALARACIHVRKSRRRGITNQQYSIQNFVKITRQKPQAHASTETQQPPLCEGHNTTGVGED